MRSDSRLELGVLLLGFAIILGSLWLTQWIAWQTAAVPLLLAWGIRCITTPAGGQE